MELALINCRQKESICGSNEMVFASRFTKTAIRRVEQLSRLEKCSWVVRADKDAPGWKIYTPADVLLPNEVFGYDLHYVEYDQSIVR